MKHSVLYFLLITALVMAGVVAHTADAASAEGKTAPHYVVILKNGQRIPSRTKPLSGFGKVRYMELDGSNRVLPFSEVDIEKTREVNARATAVTTLGTLSVGGDLAGADPQKPPTDQKTDGAEKTRRQSVRVYSATWCPYCRKLKQFLAEQGIAASITEVDTLPPAQQERAQSEMRRLTGKVSFPTVVIGNQAIAGFSPSWILKYLGR